MKRTIILCNCGGNLFKAEDKQEILSFVQQEHLSIVQISDLCSICTKQSEVIRDLVKDSEATLIIACYQRAVKLLLDIAGVPKDNIQYANFLIQDKNSLIQEIKSFDQSGTNESSFTEIKSTSDWPAWFPVIDYARCTSCGQCADFCLFGVYEKIDGKIVVVNPEGCKNNCPACARICPKTAIIFPKYEHGGAIAGDEAINELEEQERQRKDIDAILGSEIYQALERRKLKRQSIIRNNALQEAEKERERALNESRTK
jgi:NAD-dependent dihydropyrimidine dehydrogenase PreA subunit